MKQERVDDDQANGRYHDDAIYVRKCANSDLMHYELQGIQHPSVISVEVTNAGDLRKLRTIPSRVEDLKVGKYDASQIFSAEIEEEKKFKEQLEESKTQKVQPKKNVTAAPKATPKAATAKT